MHPCFREILPKACANPFTVTRHKGRIYYFPSGQFTRIAIVNPLHTEVRFASFLSGGFTTIALINPPENKLAKWTSVLDEKMKSPHY
jgi:hypothetical protein